MKKFVLGALAALATACLLTGCLTAPVMPPPGIIYNDYAAPLDYDQQESKVAQKSGEASTISILGLVATGDGSINAAAKDGKINKIHGADYKYFNVIGVYQKYTTVVYGE